MDFTTMIMTFAIIVFATISNTIGNMGFELWKEGRKKRAKIYPLKKADAVQTASDKNLGKTRKKRLFWNIAFFILIIIYLYPVVFSGDPPDREFFIRLVVAAIAVLQRIIMADTSFLMGVINDSAQDTMRMIAAPYKVAAKGLEKEKGK